LQAITGLVATLAIFSAVHVLGAAGASGPERGKTVLLKRDSGTVMFQPPGADNFTPLHGTKLVPVKTLVDTRDGAVLLTSERNHAGTADTGRFSEGLFQVRQPDARGAHTTAVLRGKVSRSCGAGHRRRTLRARAHSPFRTSGLHSSATALGTVWTMTDRCDGTLTAVRAGTGVAVRDFRTHDRIVLHAGERYLAK
jgi:hypothetical protein